MVSFSSKSICSKTCCILYATYFKVNWAEQGQLILHVYYVQLRTPKNMPPLKQQRILGIVVRIDTEPEREFVRKNRSTTLIRRESNVDTM